MNIVIRKRGLSKNKLTQLLLEGAFMTAIKRQMRTIAMKTGRMRNVLEKYIVAMIRAGINSKGTKIIVDLSNKAIDSISINVHFYLKYHVIEHGRFRFQSGYQTVSTGGTFPISTEKIGGQLSRVGNRLVRSAL